MMNTQKCDYCDATRQGRKQVFCPLCVKVRKGCDDHIVTLNSRLQDINAVLYLLDGKSVVSISCFFPNVKSLVNTWDYYVGMDVIHRLIEMLNEWSNEYGDVDVLKLLDELRLLWKRVADEIVFLRSFC